MRILITILAILAIYVAIPSAAVGRMCSCSAVSACLSFTRASSVFVGTIIAAGNRDEYGRINVRFDVSESLKGVTSELRTIQFYPDSCIVRDLKKGKKLLVYADQNGSVRACNPTREYSRSAAEVEAIREILAEPSAFTIRGRLELDPEISRSAIRIELSYGTSVHQLEIDKKDIFSVKVYKENSYTVRIIYPHQTDLSVRAYPEAFAPEIRSNAKENIATFPVQYAPSTCDDRKIEIRRSSE